MALKTRDVARSENLGNHLKFKHASKKLVNLLINISIILKDKNTFFKLYCHRINFSNFQDYESCSKQTLKNINEDSRMSCPF